MKPKRLSLPLADRLYINWRGYVSEMQPPSVLRERSTSTYRQSPSSHLYTMLSSQTPFKIPRIISLVLVTAISIAAAGLGINGLVKFDEVKSQAKKEAPPGITVNIVTGNFVPVGIVVSAACGNLAMLASILLVAKPLATRFLRLQALLFALFSLFLLAVVIPFTDFLVNRSAEFSVSAGGIFVPASIVKEAVGSKTDELEYKRHAPREFLANWCLGIS